MCIRDSISTATYIAENLDDYLYEPDQRTAEEVAAEELRFILAEQSLATLKTVSYTHLDVYKRQD